MPARFGLDMIVVLIGVLLMPQNGMARPDGAPLGACSSLTPSHGDTRPQNYDAPFTVSATQIGDKIRVTISSSVGEEFEGFVIQARSSRDKKKMVEGKFTARNGVSKTIDCFKGKKNTLTQVNTSSKSQIVTEWTPANGVNEDVIFRATVAKTYFLYWIEIDSEPVKVRSLSDSNSVENGVKKQNQKTDPSTIYRGCSVTKGCFGYPSDCIDSEDCQVLLAYSWTNGGILFRLSGILNSPNKYIAMALSLDQRMGEDAVMECFQDGNYGVLRESWNDGKKNNRTREVPRNIYSSEFSDGLITCEWISDTVIRSPKGAFNLDNTTYYLLLATGPMSNNRLGYHTQKTSTQQPVNFSAFEALEGGRVHDAIKIHGTFMVTAWVGFVSVAILLARHFKSAWETNLCGVKIWFALHRGLMIVALILVVIAFIVIFVHLDGWNYENKNPHAILGCIATAFGLFQPIMAAFRPDIENPKRPIFNWLHWIVGNSAQLIAVVTIFFARSLQASGLKESFYWVMAIFVMVYLIFHLLFQLHSWSSDKKRNNEIKLNEMRSHGRGVTNNVQGSSAEKNSSANMFRVLLLGIFVIFAVIILLALYALIGVA